MYTADRRPAQPLEQGALVAIPEVRGLHHRYERLGGMRCGVRWIFGTDKIPGRWFPREGLAQLLGRPLGGRMFGDIEGENPPRVMRQHDETEQHPERDRRDREEVQRDDLRHVGLPERPPGR
jgi:hypothetical protein